jgi:hypothetical protein
MAILVNFLCVASVQNTKEKKHRDKIATRGTMTSSFARKTPHNASLKLKDPSALPIKRKDSNPCLCILEVAEPRETPDRSTTEEPSDPATSDALGEEEIRVEVCGGGEGCTEGEREGEQVVVPFFFLFFSFFFFFFLLFFYFLAGKKG